MTRLKALLCAALLAPALQAEEREDLWDTLSGREGRVERLEDKTNDFAVERDIERDKEALAERLAERAAARAEALRREAGQPEERPAFLDRQKVRPIRQGDLTRERWSAIRGTYDRDGSGELEEDERQALRQAALARMQAFLDGER